MSDDLTVLAPDAFGPEEAAEAKRYWAGIAFAGYTQTRPWSERIAEAVLAFRPARVLEFGCNAGKNLLVLSDKAPDVEVHGLDINAAAVEHARSAGLGCGLGDETTLRAMPDGSFDVSFTVSVLDHLPHPEVALRQLLRISRTAVILYEPWLGVEGRVTERVLAGDKRVNCTPFSYSWDYPRLSAEHAHGWSLTTETAPLHERPTADWGRFYQLHTLVRRAS